MSLRSPIPRTAITALLAEDVNALRREAAELQAALDAVRGRLVLAEIIKANPNVKLDDLYRYIANGGRDERSPIEGGWHLVTHEERYDNRSGMRDQYGHHPTDLGRAVNAAIATLAGGETEKDNSDSERVVRKDSEDSHYAEYSIEKLEFMRRNAILIGDTVWADKITRVLSRRA